MHCLNCFSPVRPIKRVDMTDEGIMYEYEASECINCKQCFLSAEQLSDKKALLVELAELTYNREPEINFER